MFDPFFPLLILLAALAFVALLWISTRLFKAPVSRSVSVPAISMFWLLFAAGCAYFAWPLLFLGPDNPDTTMYVQIPGTLEQGAFNQKLAGVLQEKGFRPASTSLSSPEDPENPMYILEARSAFTRVWSQTALMTAEEATACGYRLSKNDLIANDERQYQISVSSIPLFSARGRAMFSALKQQLVQDGYGVSPKQLPCAVVPKA